MAAVTGSYGGMALPDLPPSPARSCVLMTSDCPAAKLQPATTKCRQRGNTFPCLKLLLLLLNSELVLALATKLKKSLKRREKNGELSDFYLLMNGSSVTTATVTILILITLATVSLLLNIYLSILCGKTAQ